MILVCDWGPPPPSDRVTDLESVLSSSSSYVHTSVGTGSRRCRLTIYWKTAAAGSQVSLGPPYELCFSDDTSSNIELFQVKVMSLGHFQQDNIFPPELRCVVLTWGRHEK